MAGFTFDAFSALAHEGRWIRPQLVNWLPRGGFKVWLDEERVADSGLALPGASRSGYPRQPPPHWVFVKDYVARPWTQREIDLFNLRADQGQRPVLAVTIGELQGVSSLDHVFQVHQRIAGRTPNSIARSYHACVFCSGLKREARIARGIVRKRRRSGAAMEKPKGALRRAPARQQGNPTPFSAKARISGRRIGRARAQAFARQRQGGLRSAPPTSEGARHAWSTFPARCRVAWCRGWRRLEKRGCGPHLAAAVAQAREFEYRLLGSRSARSRCSLGWNG